MIIQCPCTSGKKYEECCKVFHDGMLPQNALLLMRSRFSAYALHLVKYIISTTHPSNSRYNKNYEIWSKAIMSFCLSTEFQKLEILDFSDGSQKAFVTFT